MSIQKKDIIRQELFETMEVFAREAVASTDYLFLMEGVITGVDSFSDIYTYRIGNEEHTAVSLTGENYEIGETVYVLHSNNRDVKRMIVSNTNKHSTNKLGDIIKSGTEQDLEEIYQAIFELQQEIDNVESTQVFFAYATSETGANMTTTPNINSTYIGTATGTVRPSSPSSYTWTKTRGGDGSGVDGIDFYYKLSNSATVAPTTWNTTPSNPTVGLPYLWSYSVYRMSDGTTKQTDPVVIGALGPQGIAGTNGVDGKTYYTWIKYADTPTSGMSDYPDGKKYLGVAYNKLTASESTTYSDYTWALIQGEKGIDGAKGADGQTTYTWIKYAPNATPTAAQMSDNPNGMTYIGLAVNKTTSTESNTPSDYTWALIKGDKGDVGAKGDTGATGATGKGVSSSTVTYQLGTSGTTAPTGTWETTPPAPIAGRYLWTKTIFTYTDSTLSSPVYAVAYQGINGVNGSNGADGKDGEDGRGISSTVINYATSTNGTTAPTTGWGATVPTIPAGQYLWTRTVYTLTDASTQTQYSVAYQGANGAAGASITSITNYYLASASNSGVTTSTSGWTTSIQNIDASKPYLWNYEVSKNSAGTTVSTTAPIIIGHFGKDGATGPKGTDGAKGADGISITGIVEYYQVSSSGTTAPTTWLTTVPALTSINKYLWNYEEISYSDNTKDSTLKKVIGVYGDTGPQGPQGIQGIQGIPGTNGTNGQTYYTWVKYADSPTTGMSDYPDGKKYLGIAYNKTTATESSTYSDYTWSLIQGAQGQAGTNGTDGQTYYTWIKYAPNGSPTSAQMSDVATNMTHIGIAVNKTTATESTTPSDYTWALIKGDKGDTGAKGADGAAAKLVSLTASAQVFKVSSSNAISPTSLTVTGIAQNTSITTWTYSINGGTFSSTLPAGVTRSGEVVTITGSTMTADSITVKASDGTIEDVLTIVKVKDGATGSAGASGADAYTIVLSNESHIFPGEVSTASASSTTINILAYKGATQQSITIGTITGQVTGLTTSIANNSTSTASITVSATTALTTKNGVLTIPLTVDGKSFTKYFSWSVAYKGATGSTGATGAAGSTITSVSEEYYLSTSKTSQTGGSWVTTAPAWDIGKYLWIRTKIVYTNPASTSYTVPYVDTTWEAVNGIKVGARNILLGTRNFQGWSVGGGAVTEDEYLGGAVWRGTRLTTNTNYLEGPSVATPVLFGSEFVLSFYAKSNVVGPVTCYFYNPTETVQATSSTGQTSSVGDGAINVSLTTSWTRFWIKWKSATPITTKKSIIIGRLNQAVTEDTTIEIALPMFEVGNTPSDWVPAPEDSQNLINNLENTLNETHGIAEDLGNRVATSEQDLIDAIAAREAAMTELEEKLNFSETTIKRIIEETSSGLTQAIQSTASAVTSQGEALKEVTTSLNLLDGGLEALVSSQQSFQQTVTQNVTSAVRQDYDSLEARFSSMSIDSVDHAAKLKEIYTYFTFDQDNFTIGKSGSGFTVELTNEKLSFKENGEEIAYMSGQSLYINSAIIVKSIKLGVHYFEHDENIAPNRTIVRRG